MENKINSIENKILEFFVFTENGIKILNSQFENYFENQNEHKNFKRIIKNLSVHIVQIENKNNKQKYQKNFHFNLLKIHQFKILILIRFNIIFLGRKRKNKRNFRTKFIRIKPIRINRRINKRKQQ